MAADGLEALQAPPVYQRAPGDANRVYHDLCRALSGRPVDWAAYRPDDWRLLALMSRPENEGVGPLLYWHLKKEGWPQQMPAGMRNVLQDDYYNATGHNSLLTGELEKILAGLEAARIPVVVLKGASLIRSLYPEIGLRPMGDLDLLVSRDQFQPAGAVIKSLGYLPDHSKPALHPEFSQMFQVEAHFKKAGKPASLVELHWDLLGGDSSRLQVDLDWFYARLAPVQAEDRSRAGVSMLSPEANILFLSGHLMLKHWMLKSEAEKHARLIWFYDVFRLSELYAENMDWQAVYGAARAFNWEPALLGALYGAEARFGKRAPGSVIADRFQPLSPSLMKQAEALGLLGDRKNYKFSKMKPAAAFRYFWLHIFPSPVYMRWRYRPDPAYLWPLYYPVRWAAALRDLLPWRLGRGDVR